MTKEQFVSDYQKRRANKKKHHENNLKMCTYDACKRMKSAYNSGSLKVQVGRGRY
ncbi:hypothetical protein [Anaerosolibacter sp.]|uniref:hypothetical protein n=1 Tax=Anaerosolibacter sp. TaxID=1872527 RepID=UPI0039EE72B9